MYKPKCIHVVVLIIFIAKNIYYILIYWKKIKKLYEILNSTIYKTIKMTMNMISIKLFCFSN